MRELDAVVDTVVRGVGPDDGPDLTDAGFEQEVLPLQLESAARGGMRTRGAGLRRLQGMGPQRFLLHVDDDTEFRSRCE